MTAHLLIVCVFQLALAWIVAPAPALAQEFKMTEEQFNSWLTNGRENPKDRLQAQLQVELSLVDLSCELEPKQKEKLTLAAERDIARFEDQVGQIREEVVGKTLDQNKIGEVYQRIQPLNQQLQNGFFGPTSLFAKVLPRALTAAQQETIAQLKSEQYHRRYEAILRLYVVGLEKSLPMTEAQRQGLLRILIESTRPPSAFGQYDWYYTASQVSQVPQDIFEPLFDKAQLEVIQQARQQGEGWIDWVENQGITPVEE
ncbi:hypothetical protein [Bythopirellula polymerisocia]|uniref:Uncharacterized protein n=1 Tax=Bythopirellula polymerisocia TaxID=2528003 RepID=A0A5C6CNJ3_9BACT|nr:hypothetical protein [Bythopirellula polymerisocia]TWU26012.1 hypothetical protein Pla144_32290 [Bythopirellula polymerisocia]